MASLKQIVELYDPHPGFLGAVRPLPAELKKVANQLNGQKMVLEDVLLQFRNVAAKIGGTVSLEEKFKFISYIYPEVKEEEEEGPVHYFRLIRYK